MPVSEQTPVNSYTGNGVTTVFPYTFKLLAQADIEVTVDGVVKTLTTDYTVSGVGVDGGGNVTFVTAPANGTTVVLHRAMAYKRDIDYQENGDLPAATLDEDVDRVVMMVQQIGEENDRTIHMAVGTTGVDTELPAPEARKAIGWNATEDGLTNLALFDAGALSVSSYMENALLVANAAEARDIFDAWGGATADIASAATIDFSGQTGSITRITGTTATTAVTLNAGQTQVCVAVGAWPLTYHATNMPLPGGENYTCAAGDMVAFVKDNNGDLHVKIVPKAASQAVVSQALAQAGSDTVPRLWTAQRVAQAIAALAPGGSSEPIGSMKVWPGIALPDANWDWADGGTLSRTTYASLFAKLVKSGTVTMTIASPCVVTWTAHGLRDKMPIKFTTTGALPTGITEGTTYYIKYIDANTFNLSATPGGTNVNTSGSQSGTHTGICAPHGDGDGSTTFNKPDLRGRVPVGRDDMGGTAASRVTSAGSGINGNVPGASGGAETVSLTSAQNGSHTHSSGASAPTGGYQIGKGSTAVASTTNTGSSGSGTAHQNTQPSIIEDWIIKIQ